MPNNRLSLFEIISSRWASDPSIFSLMSETMAHQILAEEVMERLGDQAPLEPKTLEAVLDTLSEMGQLISSQSVAQQI